MDNIEKIRSDALTEIRSYKFDLDSKLDDIYNIRTKYDLKYNEFKLRIGTDNSYLDLSTLINEMMTSFISPAYYYNLYIENLIKDLSWDDNKYEFPESEWESSKLRRVKYQADAQSVFLSIKMCLDRMVTIFIYYFPGMSVNSTFGRYKENGKPHGLMSKVSDLKDSDELMGYIEKQYHEWIKLAVCPRDAITHYNDMQIQYYLDSETRFELPLHSGIKIFDLNHTSYTYGFVSIKKFIEKWYDFFDFVMQNLLNRELISDKAKF